MRILRGSLLCLCLPLLMAAALADTVPDATLRLVPTGEISPDAPLRLPQSVAAPPPAAAATPVAAQPQPQSQPMSFGPQKLAFPGNVSATFDLVYGSLKGFRPLTLDIYQPPARNTAVPLVVFVHGGGWNGGDTRHAASFPDFPRVLAALAARGYVVASVSYRLSGEARFPAAVQDVKAAIRWLRGHSRDLNVDPTRVAVWGDAAGGQLAALTGVTCGVAPFEPDAKDNGQLPSDCVQAVIDWGGASELESLGAVPVEGAKPAPAGFTAPPTSDAANFKAIGTGDFNNDGKSEIIYEDTTGGTNNAVIWLMNGTSQTGSPIAVANPGGATYSLLGAEDMNGDGYSDLLWQDSVTGNVKAVEMTAGGGILATTSFTPAGGATFKLIASTGGG